MPRDITLDRVRNIGVMAHIDAGKTTTTERVLLFTGRIHRAGEVHHGTTAMDFSPEEQAMGITINAAATTTHWAVREGARAGRLMHEHVLQGRDQLFAVVGDQDSVDALYDEPNPRPDAGHDPA